MSFNLTYTIEAEALVSQKWQPVEKSLGPFLLAGHSEKREFFIMTTEELRLRVSSERKLKPFEISILNKLPGLSSTIPFVVIPPLFTNGIHPRQPNDIG